MSGGVLRQLAARSGRRVAGTRGDRDLGHLDPELRRRAADPGQRRPEVALDVVGERLERADVEHAHRPEPAGRGSVISRSRHHRKAARVLPEPVGAWISVCRPPLMAGQPSSWARVGVANASANQVRVASLNGARGSEVGGAVTGRPVYRPRSSAGILPDPGQECRRSRGRRGTAKDPAVWPGPSPG